ncbi:MAG: hypothetical protein VB119_12660 [Candidatus Metalachnospira sp.]|nr:hypothetical protein [Candidatus Metalachnospira sp.]
MNIALCAAFLEEDLWESRLLAAAYPKRLELTQSNGSQRLLPMLELKQFSLLAVIF